MSNEDKVKEFFAKVNDVLDLTHTRIFAAVDETYVHIDRFVGEWEKRAFEAASGTGEEVKVKPDVDTMRADVISSRKASNPFYNSSLWDIADDATVENYWMLLPDEHKSWVKRDKNSPL